MTMTLDLQPEVEKGLLDQATARGMSLNDYVKQIVVREARVPQATAPAGEARNLVELFANSPFKGLDMEFERDKDHGREIVL